MVFDSPRNRRLQADLEAMNKLKADSSIIEFTAQGDPAERYIITFHGKGLMRETDYVEPTVVDQHRCEIRLGIDYPRSRPDLQWLTKIYHPNISAVGAVCLGGYGTNWVPSLNLDELVEMLWEMVRYANFDPKSAYNYQAARWAETQTQFALPLDPRPVRDRISATVGKTVIKLQSKEPQPKPKSKETLPSQPPPPPPAPAPPVTSHEIVEDGVMIIDESTPPPPPATYGAPSADDDILIIE